MEKTIKKILFVYNNLTIGGSTTSLISLLRAIDYSEYDVELLLLGRKKDLSSYVPKEVRVTYVTNAKRAKIAKLLSPSYILANIKSFYYCKRYSSKSPRLQIISNVIAKKFSPIIDKSYDVAIGFLEGWPNAYVSSNVRAQKKIAWIHTDYIKAGLVPSIDRSAFGSFDHLVTVSQDCRASLINAFPEYENKIVTINNILTADYVRERANVSCEIELDPQLIKIITVSRLTNSSKALDRAIDVASSLLEEGFKFVWYIVGDGPDGRSLRSQVEEKECTEFIRFLGEIENPYPLMKQADLFFLPSNYEGKPMSVTEAQMLFVPALVTDYDSARSQVANGVEGLVVDNNQDAIYDGLKYLLQNRRKIEEFKENLKVVDKSNYSEIDRFYDLISS